MSNQAGKIEEKKEDSAMKILKDKCNGIEVPLTEEEASMDYTGMDKLDLGEHKNYKTRIVQNRWQ